MKNRLSEINKRAWEIRKSSAAKFNCPVMQIMWKICFNQAKEEVMSSKKCLKGKSYGVYACLRHHEGMKIFIIDIGTRNVIAEADKYENAVSIMFKKGRETGRKVAMLREDHRVEEDLVLMEKF